MQGGDAGAVFYLCTAGYTGGGNEDRLRCRLLFYGFTHGRKQNHLADGDARFVMLFLIAE